MLADPIEVLASSTATIVMTDAATLTPNMGDGTGTYVDGTNSTHVSDASTTLPPSPVRGMFQTDSTALRLVSPMTWGLVADQCAYLTNVVY